MAKYQTRALTVGDLTVTVSKAGSSASDRIVAFLEVLADRMDSESGIDAPARPGQGLPPGAGHPGNRPPGSAERPDQGLPESGAPGHDLPPGVSNELPGDQPEAGQLPSFIRENAEEIAKAILKGTLCDPDKEPKR